MNAPMKQHFGKMPDGTAVEQVTLSCGALSCEILTYGGALRTLRVPDRSGNPVDVVLGFDTLEDYRRQDKYIGALIGRFANRIGGAAFELDGTHYPLAANDGENHLHGGLSGFDKQVWTVEEASADTLVLSLLSPAGQENYPGNLFVQVTYRLESNGLTIEYRAECDRDTLCNLTCHAYFNLGGHDSGPVLSQDIQIAAARYTPTDAHSIPTGELDPVERTPMDLRSPMPIGALVDDPFEQLAFAKGYDHNWAVDGAPGSLRPAATAYAPKTGVALEVLTTQPGIQFYSGNYLDGCPVGKGGAPYAKRWGFCLETQSYPDAPHHPGFPSAVLHKGEMYRQTTQYRFSAR